MQAPTLVGERITLRPLQRSDVSDEYCGWLSDPEVTAFTESRFHTHSVQSVGEFVDRIVRSPDQLMFAVVDNETTRHVGNIKLGPINWRHRFGDIGVMIGDRASWGKGFATEAIRLLTDHAFSALDLHKVTASCYHTNVGSLRAFVKAGFHQEGVKRAHYASRGEWVDSLLLAAFSPSAGSPPDGTN